MLRFPQIHFICRSLAVTFQCAVVVNNHLTIYRKQCQIISAGRESAFLWAYLYVLKTLGKIIDLLLRGAFPYRGLSAHRP
jgi:hypothetical protein